MVLYKLLPKRSLKSSLQRGLLSEFIGTMFLALTIGVVINQPTTLPALTIGMMLLTQVFAYGYIGGGMFNPAVTTGVYITMYRRAAAAGDPQGLKHLWKWALTILVQHAGAFAGANLAAGVVGTDSRAHFNAPQAGPGVSLRRSFAAELLFTCSLVLVMLNTAMARRYESSPNSFYGIGIGMSVFVGVSCVADISGAAFNPAVATALQVCRWMYVHETDAMKQCWLYWCAGIGAGIIAAVVFALITDDEGEDLSGNVETVEEKVESARTPPVSKRDRLPSDEENLISKDGTPRVSAINDETKPHYRESPKPSHINEGGSTRVSQQGGEIGKGYFQLQAEKAERKRLQRRRNESPQRSANV